jgi:CTP:molybdopterin cytidylyltransferase MocA
MTSSPGPSIHASRPAIVGAVVLAAGGSSRFGHPKQLLAYAGEPLVRRAALAARAAGAAPVVVVLGAHAELVAPAVVGLPQVTPVHHPGWAEGLASSLAAGVRALETLAACDGALVTLSDQPLVDAAALRALLARFDGSRRIVAAEFGGTVGCARRHRARALRHAARAGWRRWRRPLAARAAAGSRARAAALRRVRHRYRG